MSSWVEEWEERRLKREAERARVAHLERVYAAAKAVVNAWNKDALWDAIGDLEIIIEAGP